jgi:hypothetical protein
VPAAAPAPADAPAQQERKREYTFLGDFCQGPGHPDHDAYLRQQAERYPPPPPPLEAHGPPVPQPPRYDGVLWGLWDGRPKLISRAPGNERWTTEQIAEWRGRGMRSVECRYPECDGGPQTGFCHSNCREAVAGGKVLAQPVAPTLAPAPASVPSAMPSRADMDRYINEDGSIRSTPRGPWDPT